MLKTTLAIFALSAVPAIATASEMDAREAAKQTIELQDGSTAYVFPNGKMAVENKYGNVIGVRPGTTLQAKDGSSITMVGNETAYLRSLLQGNNGSVMH